MVPMQLIGYILTVPRARNGANAAKISNHLI